MKAPTSNPSPKHIDAYRSSHVHMHGKDYLYFSGTNYLGTVNDRQVVAKVEEGMALYGSHLSVSRAVNALFPCFEHADAAIARDLGTEAGLVVSSGFTACQLMSKILDEHVQALCYAPGVHSANWRTPQDKGCETEKAWRAAFLKELRQDPKRKRALFYKPIDPILVQKADFSWLSELPEDHALTLVLDFSHLLGVHKGSARSIFPDLDRHQDKLDLVYVGSLGKGLGIPAGFIAASKAWIDRITPSPFYIGAGMPSPAFLHAMLASENLFERHRQRLHANIAYFSEKLQQAGIAKHFRFLEQYPIFFTKHAKLYPYLLSQDILIAQFSYPSYEDRPATRVVLNGAHSYAHLDRLCEQLEAFFKLPAHAKAQYEV